MLKAISEVVGSKLVDLDTSQTIGEVVNWVVNGQERKLTALVIKQPGWLAKTRIVTTVDIVEYGPRMVVVRDHSSVVAPDEVVGMPELLATRNRIMGERVETQSGKLIGQVDDVLFETIDSSLQKLYIRPPLLGLIARPDVIVGMDRVVALGPKRIVVTDDVGEPLPGGQVAEIEA